MSKISIRINPLSKKTVLVDWVEGKSLQRYLDEFLEDYPERNITRDYFKIFVEGREVEKDFWKYVKPYSHANVLIAIVPKGGDFDTFLAAAIVITAVAISAGATAGLAPALAAGINATVGLGAALLVQGLISPNQKSNSFGDVTNASDSQMYTISSQQNAITKFQRVPKVYGNHRMFPRVAATPFTQVEADNNGEFSQYFYAIYDFGLGPAAVDNIKIGETPIGNYNDVEYRLVDLNRPLNDEGPWDENLFSDFKYYKSDVSIEPISVALNKNENDPGVSVSEYQVIRSAAANTSNRKQEVSVDIVFPQGLTSFGTNGSQEAVNVEFVLEFRPVGSVVWKRYDDLAEVDFFRRSSEVINIEEFPSAIGSNLTFDTVNGFIVEDVPAPLSGEWPYASLVDIPLALDEVNFPNIFGGPTSSALPRFYSESGNIYITGEQSEVVRREYKVKKGVTTIWELVDDIQVGNKFLIDGQEACEIIGKVAIPGGFRYTTTPSTITKTLAYDFIRVSDGKSFYKEWLPDNATFSKNVYGNLPFYITFQQQYKNDYFGIVYDTPQRFLRATGSGFDIITGNQQNPLYRTFTFAPKTTQSVEIRLTRKSTYGGLNFQRFTDATLINITTKLDKPPIKTKKRHVFLEIRIKATDQLNGAISNLSANVYSALDVYNPNTQTWSKQLTANPAWIFADLLTGEVNKRAISKDRLDVTSLVEWADYCDEIPAPRPSADYYVSRFKANFVLDYTSTLQSMLEQLGSAAQASLNIVDGKYGVIVDRQKTVPVQVFTPRNSSNFSSIRNYGVIPNRIIVKFVDPAKNWEINEIAVYDDGFDESNFETEEELEAFACTNYEQAFRHGRYMLAQLKYRQENITIDVDFEYLVCTRGDFVLITNDVMKVGGLPMRVKSVSGNQIVTDDDFSATVGPSYGYTFRNQLGEFKTSTLTVDSPDTFTLDGEIPSVGDLIIVGIVGQETYECIVKAIEPNQDLGATLTLVEKNNAIFDAESNQDIGSYNPLISTLIDTFNTPPQAVENLVVEENSYQCSGSQYQYFVLISWSVPAGTTYEIFEIYVNSGKGYNLVLFTKELSAKIIIDEENLGREHEFKVLAVNANGAKLSLGQATSVVATPVEKTSPPGDVLEFAANITNQVIQLDWKLLEECDIAYYEIRYSPDLNAKWSQANPVQQIGATTNTVSLQARTGSYLIKAYDFNGNQSTNAKFIKTSIPNLIDLNVVEETNDFPTFPGTLNLVEAQAASLVLQEQVAGGPGVVQYYPEGEYLYSAFLDLGDIYTVRLQSLIDAQGYTKDDLMIYWDNLTNLTAMSTVDASDFAVETYNRRRDSIIVMSNWTTLSGVAALSTGAEAEWTPWEKFTIGDFTGRIFQFKLVLKSFKASVSPRVFDAKIKSDMPDRTEIITNASAIFGGPTTFNYNKGFYGPGTTPNIQITMENANQGDYWQLSNRTLNGFDIEFFDKNGVSVNRTFDALIKGYGAKAAETI